MINSFIRSVRSRLNRGIALHAIATCSLAVAGVTVVASLSYIFRGLAVPKLVYATALGALLVSCVAVWYMRRLSQLQAATFADSHFKLKDALTSSLEFEQKTGEIYDIQRQQTEGVIQPLEASSVPITLPRKLALASLMSITTAAGLAFVPPSQAFLDKQADEQRTEKRTEEIQREMEQLVEELVKSLSDDEKEALEPDKLRQWVKELKQTGDKREALRNYARLEQKIQKTIDRLDQRKDEELLKNAGIKLENAKDVDAKEMGKKLKQKDFKAAADKLKEFKLGKNEQKKEAHKKIDPKTKDKFKLTEEQKKKLAEKQKQLAKLRSLTKRLAEAARQQNGKQNPGEGNQGEPSDNFGNTDLNDMLEMLDDDAEALEELLEAMELALERGEEVDDDTLEKMLEDFDGDLEELRKRFKQMNARRKARQRMKALSKALGKAQSYANGQSSQLGLGKGGKKPGFGTDDTRRKEKEPLTDNDNYDRLKGQKGRGPSQSSIESAESGTGTSRRSGEATERSYERQMDSFVERDDIPEEMKEGVKEYFKNIHRNQSSSETK